MNRETTCCFTGHRPEKLPWREDEGDPRCLELKARLAGAVEAAYEKRDAAFPVRYGPGSGFYCCEAALALRERRPGVTVEAVIPCEGAGRPLAGAGPGTVVLPGGALRQ